MTKPKDKISAGIEEKDLAEQISKIYKLKFSKNALNRLLVSKRNVLAVDMEQLQHGLEKAASKGSVISLIIVNEVAYLVSVKNSTVITLINDYSAKDRIVDNIDSIVFM